jgi:hypothetical protein
MDSVKLTHIIGGADVAGEDYFESRDPLVGRDTNGRIDVYQWERAGTGGCDEADPSFAPSSGGCVDLVSSGQSLADSAFLDADPSGNNAFFTTLEGLVPQDYGLIDIYDARVGGGFPTPSPPTAPCEGEACQGPYRPPEDSAPASELFQGAGNVVEIPAKPKCKRGKVKKKGRCVKKPQRTKAKRHRARR